MCRPANKKQKAEAVKKKKREQMYNFALMSKQNKGTGCLYEKKKTMYFTWVVLEYYICMS